MTILVLFVSLLLFMPVAAWPAVCGKAGTIYTMGTGACTGETDTLVNGDNFIDTFTDAACGDTIILTAGIHYGTRILFVSSGGPQGNPFGMPNKSCGTNQYVTMQSSALSSLPIDVRVGPSSVANMATLETSTSASVVAFVPGAGWYKFLGLQFTQTVCVSVPAPCPGSGGGSTAGFTPVLVGPDTVQGGDVHDVIYDRVLVRPYEETQADPDSVNVRSSAQGIRFDGSAITISNSWIGGFCCKQINAPTVVAQSTALGAVGGLGPFTITNNMIEAYYANLFTGGGGGPTVPITTATVSASTTTTATISLTTGLNVGDVMRFHYATCYTNSAGYCVNYGAAIVDTITGSNITFHFFGPDTPSTAPDTGGGSGASWKTTNTLVALDIFSVTRNTLNKRAAWSANSGQCKTFWEIKEGSHITFSGNTITGPIDGAAGTLCPINVAFTRNQDSSNPWAESNNNTFTSNLAPGLSVFVISQGDPYHSVVDGSGITVSNNLLGGSSGRSGIDFIEGDSGAANPPLWTITHNTSRGFTRAMLESTGFTFSGGITYKDNIVNSGSSFVLSDSQFPSRTEIKNIIINTSGGSAPGYTSGDFVVANDAAVGFTNVTSADAGGDYHGYALTGGTSCTTGNWRNCASDGTDPGVNFTTLDAALGGGGGTLTLCLHSGAFRVVSGALVGCP